jgi:uncharacterized protein YaiL (DUF2058 family)
MAEKVKRDQELNRQQQEKAEAKARAAQVKQLIETSRLPKLTRTTTTSSMTRRSSACRSTP